MIIKDMTTIRNFKHLLDYSTALHPDMIFMEYKKNGGIEQKSYAELKRDSDTLSAFLEDKGFEKAHVSLVGPGSYNWIVSFMGSVDSGCAAVPLAPGETDEMNSKLIDFSDSTVFIFDKKHKSLYERVKKEVPAVKMFISLDGDCQEKDIINISDILSAPSPYNKEPSPEDLCAIMFTSGTTGFPKGVMLTHKNFIYTGTSAHVTLAAQKMLACIPLNHAFGLTGLLTKTLVLNRTLCLNDELKNVAADFQLYKPNSIQAVPQMVKFFFSSAFRYAKSKADTMSENEAVKEFFGGEMISMFCGGAPLEAAANARFDATGIHVLNGYGMTECAPIIANNSDHFQKHGSVGRPIPCMEVKIRDGEVILKGPNVMKGYYKNPEATKAAFTEDGYLHTGDLGYLDEDGYLYITGRCKNLILLDNGENVSAEYLEEKLAAEPLIKESICFGENGAIYAEIYPDKTYMAENGITNIDKEMPDLLMRVNKNLAVFQHISGYILRDTPFPRTASAKIKRNLPHGKVNTRELVLPSNDAELRVYDAVKAQLGIENISMTDNYFAIGGDSINAVELALSLNIKPQLVYDNPFLSALAKILDSDDGKTAKVEGINNIIEQTKTNEIKGPYKCALLTGATGFLGIHILKELADRGLRVYCLVRDPNRLMKQIKYYFGHIDLNNIATIPGNIEKDKLGLSQDDYKKLIQQVDVVFHVAANVHHAGDYADLERTNVKGTENIIKFCIDADAVLQHTSTVSVHGSATVLEKRENCRFDEDMLDIGQTYTDNVYIHSKYCAEEKVLLARKNGLRANIFRMGNLTWRNSDGKFQINSADNGFLHRIHAILKLGVWHEGMEKYPMDLTAVDECADGYVRLALNGKVNKIYHMYNPNYLDERDMFKFLDVPYKVASTTEMIETAEANLDDRDIHVYIFYIIISGKSSEIDVHCEQTVKALKEEGFTWPEIDKRYLTLSTPEAPMGHPLNYDPVKLRPMITTGGKISPTGQLTLGAIKKTKPKNSKLICGENSLSKLREELNEKGLKNPLIITISFRLPEIEDFITSMSGSCAVFRGLKTEPTVSDINRAYKTYTENFCDCVIGIGGGSVIDTAKLTAIKAANPDEKIQDSAKLKSDAKECVPLFIAPTTAGTGSEVTLFAMATEEDKNKKHPFTTDKFLPDTVVLDPLLTVSVPLRSTAFTGIDALSHATESYLSLFATSFPEDAKYAPKAAKAIFENLPKAIKTPKDITIRSNLQKAAYNAGLSFRRISTGYIHAIAHRLGEFYHIPHGFAIACAFTPVLRAYLPYGADRMEELALYCGVGQEGKTSQENALAYIDAVDDLISTCGIDKTEVPFDPKDAFEIARKAQEEAKLVGYPRPFTDKQLEELIISIFR